MESIEAILKMNSKHPPGRRSTCIDDLCARVEALEKENKELRDAIEQAREGPPVPRSATEAPTDEDLLAFLRERPGRSLAQICDRFDIPYCYSAVDPSRAGKHYGYTEECHAIRAQLQRLRRAGRIRSEVHRWMI